MKKASASAAFCRCQAIGVDVSKAELVIAGHGPDGVLIHTLCNELNAVRQFVKGLRKGGYVGPVICESTGHYHLKLVLACSEQEQDIVVLNPLQSSKHSQSRIRKTKTDAVDAVTLATMALTEPRLPKPLRLDADKALMRLKMGQLAALEKQLQQGQRSLRQYEETYHDLGLELSAAQRGLRAHFAGLKQLRQQLQQELEELLCTARAADDPIERLATVPGYSALTCGLVGQFDRQVKDADAWVAYVGLDVSVRQSGTWQGRGRLSKRGNAYLRKRLYQAAWGAYMHDGAVRAYYERLKAEGRRHKEALCIIARKLLRIAYQILVNGKTYDPTIAFR